jgi:hypothetical protein
LHSLAYRCDNCTRRDVIIVMPHGAALWAIALAGVLASANAITTSFKGRPLGPRHPVGLVTSFGVLEGAQLSVSLSVRPPARAPWYLAAYRQGQWDAWLSEAERDPENMGRLLCSFPAAARFEITGADAVIHTTLNVADMVAVMVITCADEVDTLVNGTLALINPGLGSRFEHLSTNDAGLPGTYSLLAAAYAAITMLWLAACALNRAGVSVLHASFLLAVGAKCLEIVLTAAYYTAYGATGDRNAWTRAGASLCQTASLAVYLGYVRGGGRA